ncbi:zinc-ribbon domain containing protein [Chloroflexota bacterium]
MLHDDITIICRHCGGEFVFTKAEQEFYKERDFNEPRRCPECRAARAGQVSQAIQPSEVGQAIQPSEVGQAIQPSQASEPCVTSCFQCGTELEEGILVYCPDCVENIRLDYEEKNSHSQQAASAAHTKLLSIESREAELSEELRQRDQLLEDMKQEISVLSQDLEKAYQFQSVIGPIESSLSAIEERLASMDQSQTKIKERMLKLAEKIYEMQELYSNTSLLDMIKRSFKSYQGQSAWQK